MSKWNSKFFGDLADREIATAGGAVIAVLTATGADTIPSDPKVWWTLVGIPVVVTFLKAIVMNASTGTETAPSASLFNTSSNGS